MNQEKIIEALKTIKETCESYDCVSCPFSIYGECKITLGSPDRWKIKELDVFKAFQE